VVVVVVRWGTEARGREEGEEGMSYEGDGTGGSSTTQVVTTTTTGTGLGGEHLSHDVIISSRRRRKPLSVSISLHHPQ